MVGIGARPNQIGLEIGRESQRAADKFSQSRRQSIDSVYRVPGYDSILCGVGVKDDALFAAAVAASDTCDFVAKLRKAQWQFAKSAEAIVEQILAHVLALGEDEDFHLR